MPKFLTSGLGLALLFVALIAINIAGGALGNARVDLTEDKLYTLSEGTKNILADLDKEEPVRLRLYYSDSLADDLPNAAGLSTFAKQIRDQLEGFERAAEGGLKFEEFDPEPYSEVEDQAVQYGMQGMNAGGTDRLYFGLVGTNSVGDEETIPFFDQRRERFVEYDLADLIYRLGNPEQPVLGLLSSLPIEGAAANPMNPQPPQPWVITDQLRRSFDMRTILPTSGTIPDEVTLLVVVHPKELGEEMLYAIDQYVVKGGRAVFMVDPWCETEVVPRDPNSPMASMMADRSSNLERLFSKWGFEVVPEKIAADDLNSPFAVATRDRSSGRESTVRNVTILSMSEYETADGKLENCLNEEDVAVSDLRAGVNFSTSGILRKLPDSQVELTPLIRTSDKSMLIDKSSIQFQADYSKMLAEFSASDKRYTLAARISGEFKSAFDAAPVPAEGGEMPEHVATSTTPGNLVVIADADFLHDRLWAQSLGSMGGQRLIQQFADNGNFVINLLDNMSGSSDLISLRGRGGFQRPFTRVQELKRAADQRFKQAEEDALARIADAEKRIGELQQERSDQTSMILTPEQEAEIDRINDERVSATKALREVRYNLDKDIDSLGTRLKFANIGLIPLILTLLAGASALLRKKKTA